eukprot:4188001-Prymnesium_polylepis.1
MRSVLVATHAGTRAPCLNASTSPLSLYSLSRPRTRAPRHTFVLCDLSDDLDGIVGAAESVARRAAAQQKEECFVPIAGAAGQEGKAATGERVLERLMITPRVYNNGDEGFDGGDDGGDDGGGE